MCVSVFFLSTSASAAELPIDASSAESQFSDSYADKVLAKDTSFLGFIGRTYCKFFLFGIGAILSSGDMNRSMMFSMLANEGLVAAGLFSDVALIRTHKNSSWWQLCKTQDTTACLSDLPVDYSDHVTKTRKIMTTVWAVFLSSLTSQKVDKTGQPDLDLRRVPLCAGSYVLAELLRQKMIDKNDSPRMANIVAILAAGGMNELVKKVI